eukprot:10585525-Heterocapsa_arctica.AAC.1
MGGWPAAGSNPWGMKQTDGGAPGAQNAGVADPGPPPARTATPWMGPPEKWVAGQFTPATYSRQGVLETWKQVKAGYVNPWDQRVATATNAEWQDYSKLAK